MRGSTVIRILALIVFLLGIGYLYVALEAVRIGAISPLNYGLTILGVIVIPLFLNSFAKKQSHRETAE